MAFEERIGKHAKHAKVDEAVEQEAVLEDVRPDDEVSQAKEPEIIAPPGESQKAAARGAHAAAADDSSDVDVADDVIDDAEDISPNQGAEPVEVQEPADEPAEPKPERKLDIPAIDNDAEDADDVEGDNPDGEEPDEATQAFVPAFDMEPKKGSHKIAKRIGIGFGVLAGLVLAAYLAGIAVFSNWFLPNTTIGGIDMSLKSSDEAAQLLDEHVANYKLDVTGGNFAYHVDAEKLGLVANSRTIISDVHNHLESWKWPYLLWEGAHDESDLIQLTYLESATANDVRAAVVAFNEGATPPQNACVIYNPDVDAFVVQSEVAGTQYQPEVVAAVTDEAIRTLAPAVKLGNEQLIQPAIFGNDMRLSQAANQATKMINAHLRLSLEGVDGGEVGPDQLHELVSITDNYEARLDEDRLLEWVEKLTEGYNTVGAERTYTRPDDGKEITVDGGAYGWEVDSEALREEILQGVKEGATKTIEVPCTMIGEAWNGVGQVDWGNRYIDVDLSEQYVRFFDENSEIIWESDCITGAPDGMHNTVEGVWYITAKESPSKLVGYEHGKKIYETYVTWWMPFEGNEIGFHDANWQPAFGGYMYASGYGSHGCVNLPVYKAEELYYIVEVNDVVIVHW